MQKEKEDVIKENLNSIKTANFIVKAVSNPLRQKIISMLLLNGQMPVHELREKLNSEQSVMSQHLAILRKANVVNSERRGKTVLYSANQEYLQEIIDCMLQITRHLKK